MNRTFVILGCLALLLLLFVSVFFGKKYSIFQPENSPFSLGESFPKKTKTVENRENSTVERELAKIKNPEIVVSKKERKLEIFEGKKLIKTYPIGLGFAPVGDKQIEGDGKTPEGEFYIYTKNANSNYYLSLGLSYPSIKDAQRGLTENLINKNQYDQIVKAINSKQMPPQKTKLGGEIFIHGHGSASDWTLGCIALSNKDVKEIFDAIPVGTTVKINP